MKKLLIILSLFNISIMFGAAEPARPIEETKLIAEPTTSAATAETAGESMSIPPHIMERKSLLEILQKDFAMSPSEIGSFIRNLKNIILDIELLAMIGLLALKKQKLNMLRNKQTKEKFFEPLYALLSWRGVEPSVIAEIRAIQAAVVEIEAKVNELLEDIQKKLGGNEEELKSANELKDVFFAETKNEWKELIKPLFLLYYALFIEVEIALPEIIKKLSAEELSASYKPTEIEKDIKSEYGITDLWD